MQAGVPREKITLFQSAVLGWFREHGRWFPWRESSASCYQKVIAEILLQRTRAETVAAFFPGFVKRFPSWTKLAEATEDELKDYLQPVGLWRRRASTLVSLASVMKQRRGRFPRNRGEIEALPGIGQYIANAVLLLCHGEPQPLVDVNMARVLERCFGPRKLADIRHDPYLQSLAADVVQGEDPLALNWGVLDLAALVCTRRAPRCAECPVANMCLSSKHHGGGLFEEGNTAHNRPYVTKTRLFGPFSPAKKGV